MLVKSENEVLTQVGPGTPMGELMRRYWQPIAAAKELDDNPFRTKGVRVMGEDLVLYRDRSGDLGLIERYCPHRRVDLAIGVVEQDGLRCQYHGWKFDASGTCTEQPFEDTVHPEDNFRAKCSIAGYPVQELAGLIWAYLGPQPAPLLPHWEPLTWDNAVRDIAMTELPCNWLQCQENSLDPVHHEWLHMYFGTYAREVEAGQEPSGWRYKKHLKVAFDPFEHGIIKRRIQEGDAPDDDDWVHGHPALFPNILLVGSQFQTTLQFRVPVDDTHTLHISLYTWPAAPGQTAPAQAAVPYRYVPLYQPSGAWDVALTFNQDYMAWVTQGPIAKRDLEKLGASDRGIILFRHQLREQMERVREGEEPSINVFRDPAQAAQIALPLERVKFGNQAPKKYVPGEAGYSADRDLIEATLATWRAAAPAREPELVTA